MNLCRRSHRNKPQRLAPKPSREASVDIKGLCGDPLLHPEPTS